MNKLYKYQRLIALIFNNRKNLTTHKHPKQSRFLNMNQEGFVFLRVIYPVGPRYFEPHRLKKFLHTFIFGFCFPWKTSAFRSEIINSMFLKVTIILPHQIELLK